MINMENIWIPLALCWSKDDIELFYKLKSCHKLYADFCRFISGLTYGPDNSSVTYLKISGHR